MNPTVNSTPRKVCALQQIVRKSFVNQSWAQMDLASELSGSDALARIQNRVLAYWERQWEKRLIASLPNPSIQPYPAKSHENFQGSRARVPVARDPD
jgi:hypothetical protein